MPKPTFTRSAVLARGLGASGRSLLWAVAIVLFSVSFWTTAQQVPEPRLKSRPKLRSKALMNRPVKEDSTVMLQSSQTSPTGRALSTGTDPSPPPSESFLALGDNGTVAPPDTSGAVGPTHIVVALASELRYQTRGGASLLRTNLTDFWAGLSTEVYDPRVVYDPYSQRFIMTASGDSAGVPLILVAVTRTSNPQEGWHRFGDRTDLTNPVFGDSPTLGFNKNWIVVQANMFHTNTFQFVRSEVYVYNKTNLYNGVRDLRRLAFDPEMGGSQTPATVMDPTLHALHLVMDWNGAVTNVLGQIVGGYLRVFNVGGPIGAERLITTNAAGQAVYVRLAGQGWDSFGPNDEDFLPQLGATNKIYGGDSRIQNVVYREGLLWTTHTVFLPAWTPNRAAVQWWSFTPGGTIVQSGALDDPNGLVHYAFPSIGVNQDLDVLLGYSRFSASQYASANYAFRSGSDAFGYLRDDTVLKEGEGPYRKTVFGLTRWGDWSATMIDPVNDTDLWTIQEFANGTVTDMDRWGTWWGRVSPPSDLGVTVTDTPDPVFASETINYFVQLTNKQEQVVSGTRAQIILPPGTTFLSATPSQGSCGHTNGTVTCLLGQIGPFATQSVSLAVKADVASPATNIVYIWANGPDIDTYDNSAMAVTTVRPSADLSVEVVGTPGLVHAGNNVSYSIVVSNRGPSSASGVSLLNTLPASMALGSVNASQGTWVVNGADVTFTVGPINVGATATFSVVGTASGSGMITNRTQVSSASTADLNTANNVALTATRVNARPVIGPIATQSLSEDTPHDVVFTISDAETAASSLQLAVSSSNQGVIPNSGLTISPTGGSRTLTVRPALNQSGNNITITLTVTDADGAVTSSAFLAHVAAVNDPPTISNINDLGIDEEASTGPIAFTVGDVDNSPGSLVPSAFSSNETLVPLSNISFGGFGGSRTITIVPATNQFGTATITVNVSDGLSIASDTFVLTVNNINDIPVISRISDQTTNEDAPTPQIAFTISDVENIAPNLTTTATSSNPLLVPDSNLTILGTNETRHLVITPLPDQFGTATITVAVTDRRDASATTTFLLTVREINDPPRLDPIAAVTSFEEAGRLTVNLSGIGTGAANESQNLILTATVDRSDLINNLAVNYTSPGSAGTLAFDTIPDAFGSGVVTVTVDDGGSTNRFFSQSFTVMLAGVNDPPTIDPIADRTIGEDAPEQSIVLTGISEGPPNESNQTLSLIPSSSESNIIANLAVDYVQGSATGTLRFTPMPNAYGTATLTVTLNDARPTNAITTRSFTVQVLSVNDVPTITGILPQRIPEDTSLAPVPFTIADIETSAGGLGLAGTSSNPTLVSDSNIKFGGAGSDRNVTVMPTPDMSGVAIITIRVSDPEGGFSTTSFELTVDPVNDPPTLVGVPTGPIVLDEDAGQQVINLSGISAGPADEAGQTLVLSATSSNPAIVPHPAVEYTSPNDAGVLRFAPSLNATGAVNIAVSLRDSVGAEIVQNFQVNVLPINDLPVIAGLTDQAILEDSALAAWPFQIDDVETPAAQLAVFAFSSNPDLVADSGIVFGGTGRDRTLTIRPITNEFGAAFITVIVTDGNGDSVESGFFLVVDPINDAPAVGGVGSQTSLEDLPTGTIRFWVRDPETPEDSLTYVAQSSNLQLVPEANIALGGSGTNRSVVITPMADGFGTALIRILVSDGEAVSSNEFQLTVTSVNDAPTLASLPDLVISEDAGTQDVTLAGISPGAANEGNQVLIVSAVSSAPGLIPSPQVIYSNPGTTGTLRFTPVANASGLAVVTVTVSDQQPENPTVSRTFQVTVQGVNDVPAFLTTLSDRTMAENTTASIPVSITDVESAATALNLTATSSNEGLVPNSNVGVTGSGANRTLTITPVAHTAGTTFITLTLNDPDQGTNTQTFQLTVTPVNDPPTLATISNVTINEDAGVQVVSLSGISSGAPNEAQTLQVSASVNNPGLVQNLQVNYTSPAATGTVSFRPAANSNGLATITVSVNDGGASNNLVSRTFDVTVLAANDAPTISDILDSLSDEDIPVTNLFTIGDVDDSLGSLLLTGSSSNPLVVQDSGIRFIGSGPNRTVIVTPVPHQSGSADITVNVSDGTAFVQDVFRVTFTAVNDAPIIGNIANRTIPEDGSTGAISFTVWDPESAPSGVSVSASASNSLLLPGALVVSGTGTNKSLTLTPAANQAGSATIVITARDPQGSQSTSTFTLNVTSVNDLPVISAVPAQTTDEDVPISLPFTVGDVETAVGALSASATSGNTTLLPPGSMAVTGVGANRTLAIAPAPDAFGNATITITVGDGSANVTRVFVLTVNEKNDPPTITPISNVGLNEDAGERVITLTGISTGAANENQALAFTATSSNPLVIPNPVIGYTNGNSTASLVLNPVANASGVAQIMVRLSDGVDEVNRRFTVTVDSVNDAPVLSSIANQTTAEDTPAVVNFTASDAETAFLSFTLASTNTALVPLSNIAFNGAGNSQSMIITPATNVFGTTRITLSASDGTNTTSTNFVLTVTAVNDAPTLNGLPNLSLVQNPPNQTINLSGITSGAANENQTLTVRVTSSNTGLVPNPTVSYTSPNTTGSFVLNPANSQNGTSVISVTVSDNGSPSNGITRTFTVYIRPSGNANPTIAGVTDQTIVEDMPLTIPITIGDDVTPATSLGLLAFSSNTNLVPINALTFGGAGANRTLTVTPALNQTGTSTVTVAVTDANSGYASTSFLLTVSPVNDLPTITGIGPQSISEDGVLGPIAFSVSDAETPAGALTITADSSDAALVPVANLVLGGSGGNRGVMVIPAPHRSGAATITLTVTDGNGASTNTSFNLTVSGQNDPPTLSNIINQTIAEDSSTGLLPFTIGDTETPANSLTLAVTSSNPGLLPNGSIILGGSGTARSLIATPLPDQFGVTVVSITVTDGDSAVATDSFVLNVTPVNDGPRLDPIANVTVDKNSGAQTVNLTGITFGPANEGQTLAISADSSNPAVVPVPSVAYTSPSASGVLTFTPVAETNGMATITVTVSDGQSLSGTITRVFTVRVRDGEPPPIRIARSISGQVLISWPATGAFTLQSTTELPPLGAWTDAGLTATLQGENYIVTDLAGGGQKFYRLRN